MLENLINLVRDYAGDAIVNNNAVPNEHNENAINATASSITNVLSSAVQNGNLDGIMNLFKGGEGIASNPLVGNIINEVKGKLTGEMNVNDSDASSITSSLIPNVLQQFVSKTNDPNDSSFDLKDIMSNIGGGNLDLGSVMSNFTGGSNNNNGIGDMLGNIFGK